MIFRFRSEYWYWCVVVMARNLLITSLTTLPIPEIAIALIILVGVLVYTTFTAVFMPWRTHILNLVDVACSCSAIISAACACSLVGVTDSSTRNIVGYTWVATVISVACLLMVFIGSRLYIALSAYYGWGKFSKDYPSKSLVTKTERSLNIVASFVDVLAQTSAKRVAAYLVECEPMELERLEKTCLRALFDLYGNPSYVTSAFNYRCVYSAIVGVNDADARTFSLLGSRKLTPSKQRARENSICSSNSSTISSLQYEGASLIKFMNETDRKQNDLAHRLKCPLDAATIARMAKI